EPPRDGWARPGRALDRGGGEPVPQGRRRRVRRGRHGRRVPRVPTLGALSMRRNASTVGVLPGPAPAEVLAAVARSMNVALIGPKEPAAGESDELEAAAGALQQAGKSSSAYALVPADPLAALAASWQAMWDVSRPEQGPAGFEAEALKALTAWRSGQFELPDYYLILAAGPVGPAGPAG